MADLSTKKVIAKWQNKDASSNFPMALDEENNRLFIGCRSPAKLRTINTQTGENIFTAACSGDADDVFYDMKDSLVFVSAGKELLMFSEQAKENCDISTRLQQVAVPVLRFY